MYIFRDLVDGFSNSSAQISPAYLKTDGHVPGTILSVDVVGIFANFSFRHLGKRDALARRREHANTLNGFFRIAIWLQISDDDVVNCLSLQNLTDGIAAHRG